MDALRLFYALALKFLSISTVLDRWSNRQPGNSKRHQLMSNSRIQKMAAAQLVKPTSMKPERFWNCLQLTVLIYSQGSCLIVRFLFNQRIPADSKGPSSQLFRLIVPRSLPIWTSLLLVPTQLTSDHHLQSPYTLILVSPSFTAFYESVV